MSSVDFSSSDTTLISLNTQSPKRLTLPSNDSDTQTVNVNQPVLFLSMPISLLMHRLMGCMLMVHKLLKKMEYDLKLYRCCVRGFQVCMVRLILNKHTRPLCSFHDQRLTTKRL